MLWPVSDSEKSEQTLDGLNFVEASTTKPTFLKGQTFHFCLLVNIYIFFFSLCISFLYLSSSSVMLDNLP